MLSIPATTLPPTAFTRETLDRSALTGLKLALPTLCVVISAFGVVDFLASPSRILVGESCFVVAALAAAVWSFVRRDRVPAAWAHALVAFFAASVAGAILLRFYLGSERICAIFLMMVIVAFGRVSLSRRWFFPSLAGMAGVWLLLSAGRLDGRSFVEYGLAMFGAIGVAHLTFEVRLRSLLQNAELIERERDARRKLEVALASAHHELVERVRVEAEREQLRDQLLQAQKMEAIGRLAGGLAHDMNNVLASVSGLSAVLCEELTPGSTHHEDAMTILKASQRGADLTRNLLAFSRKGKYRQEELFLETIVRDVTQLLERTLGKETKIAASFEHGDTLLEGDPGQLHHALLNVCLNASDAMEGAGVIRLVSERVTVADASATKLGLAAGEYVALRVIDHGFGMDADTKKKVFEPFFTTKSPGNGSGLGLSMVYGTMQSHGGSVDVQSEPGHGTTVSLFLPARGKSTRRDASMSPRMRVGRGTILVVDDEPLVRASATRVLGRLGYAVLLASDGQEAIDVYRRDHAAIDLVLLDMAMPVMGGAECFARLQEINSDVRVVICSGYAGGQETEALLANGATAFVEKPYSLTALSDAVERAMRKTPAPSA